MILKADVKEVNTVKEKKGRHAQRGVQRGAPEPAWQVRFYGLARTQETWRLSNFPLTSPKYAGYKAFLKILIPAPAVTQLRPAKAAFLQI